MGCDCFSYRLSTWQKCFNPRTRVGCDYQHRSSSRCRGVSIHAPVWGATFTINHSYSLKWFQSTHPCGVRQPKNCQCCGVEAFQSTHPCGVRLIDNFKTPLCAVSIHAPVWGATTQGQCNKSMLQVSIHAPVWGATKIVPLSSVPFCFNPRTRVGCDAVGRVILTRGSCFNPRTRVGCDDITAVLQVRSVFQSTHPCGVRHKVLHICERVRWFQSTHPYGVRRRAAAQAKG